MKKAFLSILLASAMAAPIFAQGPANPPDPAQFVARRVQHLTTLLDLNPGQQQTATTAYTTAATANEALRSQLRTARQTLKTDVQGGNAANISNDAAAVGALEGKILANDATAEQALWGVLSSSQQDKLKALGPGGMGMGPGPGGPRGFGGPR